MSKRLIWVEGDDFTGWCSSHCTWGITVPRLETTVAALAFNRLAQETIEKHVCAHSSESSSLRPESPPAYTYEGHGRELRVGMERKPCCWLSITTRVR
jgi:hypothetical protein